MGEAAGPAPGRYAAVDVIKASPIVAVVFTHARGESLPPPSSWDFWLCASWAPFQVPAFLFASGFLAAQVEALPLARVRALPPALAVPARVACTLAVVGGLALAARGREAGPVLRLRGDASLAIYLFHRIFQLLLEPRLAARPEPAGTLGLAFGGLGGGVVVALLARLGLGAARARRWLGA